MLLTIKIDDKFCNSKGLVKVGVFFTEDLSNFVTKFQWDIAKYPIKQSLRNLTEIISKVCLVVHVHSLKKYRGVFE